MSARGRHIARLARYHAAGASAAAKVPPGTVTLARTAQAVEISLRGDIGAAMAEQVRAALSRLSGSEPLVVRLDSPGGYLGPAFEIMGALVRHAGPSTCVVEGLALSAATVVVCACRRVTMDPSSMLMVHEPYRVIDAHYPAEQIQEDLDALAWAREMLIAIYALRTGKDREVVEEWVRSETWLTAHEAVAVGFADAVADSWGATARAAFDLRSYGYKRTPPALLAEMERRGGAMPPAPRPAPAPGVASLWAHWNGRARRA